MTLIFFLGMVASLVLQFLASAGNKHILVMRTGAVYPRCGAALTVITQLLVGGSLLLPVLTAELHRSLLPLQVAACCIQHRGVSIQWQIGTNTEQRHTKIAKPGQNGQNTGSIRAHSCNNYIREKRLCCSPLLTPQPCSCIAACVRDEA